MRHNKIIWLLVSGILIFALTGCQPTAATTAPVPTANATEPQQVSPTEASYPASSFQTNPTAESYPAPTGILDTGAGAYPYPSPQEGATTISWDQAEQLISAGNVTSLVQTQSLDVTLTLKTGETYKTIAPAADSAQKAITTCGEPCKNLTVTNQ